MCSKEKSEQTPGLTHFKRHCDNFSNCTNEEVMCYVGPESAITVNMIDSVVEFLVGDLFHVKSDGVQPEVSSTDVEVHKP